VGIFFAQELDGTDLVLVHEFWFASKGRMTPMHTKMYTGSKKKFGELCKKIYICILN